MVDDVDKSSELNDLETENHIRIALREARIPVGEPGICKGCNENSLRLVRQYCAPCRDELKLP